MDMVVSANIASILEVVETLVANITIVSTSTNTILATLERSVCVTSTFIPTTQLHIAHLLIWTNYGHWCPNRLVSNMRRTQKKHQLSTVPELDSLKFWDEVPFLNNLLL